MIVAFRWKFKNLKRVRIIEILFIIFSLLLYGICVIKYIFIYINIMILIYCI